MITGKTAGEVFGQIRHLIQTGKLGDGDALPTVRDLATTLDVNRNTVAAAYKRLTDAGLAVSKGRNGTFIRTVTENLVPLEGSSPDITLRDLSGGNPCPAMLPTLHPVKFKAGLYGERTISEEIESIARNWLKDDIGEHYELNLTNGAVDAVERLLTSYLIPGDQVAVEDPCFLSSINTINTNRFKAAGVPVDEEGMIHDSLADLLSSGIQALIITPRAHNPTGFSLSAQRARRIRALLKQYPQVLVIIDDHFSLLSTHEYHHIIPDTTMHWALIRSTSKFLGPDFRLAFVASDVETSLRLQQRLNSGTNWVSHMLQGVASTAILSSTFQQEIDNARAVYRESRQLLVDILKRYHIPVSSQHDGLNVWIPMDSDSRDIVMQLAERGWLVRGGEIFGLSLPAHGLRITVSTMTKEEVELFAKTLAGLLSVHRQRTLNFTS